MGTRRAVRAQSRRRGENIEPKCCSAWRESFFSPRFEILDANRKRRSSVKSAESCDYPNGKMNDGISLLPMYKSDGVEETKASGPDLGRKADFINPCAPPDSIL